MKKSSLMGASVVAAALLAAAPVVAPVASLATPGTQVVKADTDDNTKSVAQKITSMATSTTLKNEEGNVNYGYWNDFSAQLNAVPHLSDYRTNLHYFKTNATATDAFRLVQNNSSYILQTNQGMVYGGNQQVGLLLKYFFSGQNQVNLGTLDNFNAASRMAYTIKFDYSNAIGTNGYPILDAGDVERVQSDMLNNGGTVTMSMQLYDGAGQKVDNGLLKSTVSYNVKNARAAYVNYNDTLSAHVGDSADIYALSNSFLNANGKIRDYNGNDITTAAYDNGAISVTQLGAKNVHPDTEDSGIVNGNFTRPGQYYQKVVINLTRAGLSNIDNWADAVRGGLISVNGQTPSITNSDANVYLVTGVDGATVDGQHYDAGSLILKRTVNVGSANLATKDEKVDGIVTVHTSDVTTAPLYDEDGNVIVDRSVINKSKWKTNLKRTVYANGKVFYRVSTHEYISADQVTFEATDTSSSADVVKGDVVVTPLPSRKVIKVNNAGTITDLWNKSDDNKSMTRNPDRHVPGESSWQTDQTATVNGITYYRVSTNEWINAKFVTLQ